MNGNLYNAIISHANTNIKAGKALFNELEKIDSNIAELSETNTMTKYSSIAALYSQREYIMRIYAKNNHLI